MLHSFQSNSITVKIFKVVKQCDHLRNYIFHGIPFNIKPAEFFCKTQPKFGNIEKRVQIISDAGGSVLN